MGSGCCPSSIGNDGPDSVRAPGFFPEPLSVGAVAYDRTSWETSSGGYAPEPFQTRMCPDIAGFGVKVVSCTGRDPQGKSHWGWKSGTSMATPVRRGHRRTRLGQPEPDWCPAAPDATRPRTGSARSRAGAGRRGARALRVELARWRRIIGAGRWWSSPAMANPTS